MTGTSTCSARPGKIILRTGSSTTISVRPTFSRNNTAEAEKSFSRALELMPKSAEVFQRIGLIYEKQKKWDLALNAYKKAYDLDPHRD